MTGTFTYGDVYVACRAIRATLPQLGALPEFLRVESLIRLGLTDPDREVSGEVQAAVKALEDAAGSLGPLPRGGPPPPPPPFGSCWLVFPRIFPPRLEPS
jgi:hypothetical protein